MSNQVLFDNAGKPSIMVRIPKFKVSDVIPGAKEVTHPAFIVNGGEVQEIYISKYQNIIVNDRAYSLPFQKPAVDLSFDEAKKACENKGSGWHLMTNAEWAAVMLWSMKNGTLPRGNNNWGSNYDHEEETGICFDGRKVLTGSGPATWSHDHTQDGIYDLVGNVWEWVDGLRLVNGEIQIAVDNEWQPIMVNGQSVKFSETDDGLKLTTQNSKGNWNVCRFNDLEVDIEIPDALKELVIYPTTGTEITDYIWAEMKGQRAALRGGRWNNASSARSGFFLFLGSAPSSRFINIGFRAAFGGNL